MGIISSIGKAIGGAVKNIGKGISKIVKGIGHTVGKIAKGVGSAVRNVVKVVWNTPLLRTAVLGAATYFTGGMLAPMLASSLGIGMEAATMLGGAASGAILGGLGSMAAGKGFGKGALVGGLTGLATGYFGGPAGASEAAANTATNAAANAATDATADAATNAAANAAANSAAGVAAHASQGGLLNTVGGAINSVFNAGKTVIGGITHFADAHPGVAKMALAGIQSAFSPDQIDLQNNQAALDRQYLAYKQSLNQVPVDNGGLAVSGGFGNAGYMQGGGMQGGGLPGQNTIPVQGGLLATVPGVIY